MKNKFMTNNFKRRNLPHLYLDEGIYFITARLADAIPLQQIKNLHEQFKTKSDWNFDQFKNHFTSYDDMLDISKSNMQYILTDESIEILKQVLHELDGKVYDLICYCIMPNHFHFVFELINKETSISKIMQKIKGGSAYKINKALYRSGKLWQEESYDRLVRDDIELFFIIRYILLNPIKAGLVEEWRQWKHTYCQRRYEVLE